MTISIIRFINIYIAALLTGASFGIWIGFNPSNLSPSTYIEQQQNMIQSLNLLLSSLAILVTLITLVSAFLQKGNKQVFISLIAAALLFNCLYRYISIWKSTNQQYSNDMDS